MNETSITDYITATFPDAETAVNYGYTFFFQGSDRLRPFATLAASDNDHDRVSHLNRTGVFRLNIGVSRETFHALFGTEAADTARHDFTALDTLMPHPDYARQHFLCVLNPGEATWEKVRAFLAEAYEIARRRNARPAGSNPHAGEPEVRGGGEEMPVV